MFNVRDFGALGDGTHLDSPAIQAAISAAATAGGGTVVVPPGIYRCGTISLASRITLTLENGAVIRASHDLADYPTARVGAGMDAMSHHGIALLRADDAEQVSVIGGTIDGQGPTFWEPSPGPRQWIKPKTPRVSPLCDFRHVTDLRITDVKLLNSPGWTLHLFCCDRVWVRGVHLDNNLFGPNTDGFDINGCRDVAISDCNISCGDDAIVLKATKNARSCERVTVTNCVLRTNCVALKCGTESWHDFRHITMSNCVVINSTRAFGLYAFDGGTMEQILVENIACDTNTGFMLNRPIHIDARQRTPDSRRSVIRDVMVRGFSAVTDGRILLTCADGCKVENVALSEICLRYPVIDDPNTDLSRNARSAQFSSHSIEARLARAAIVADGIHHLTVTGLRVFWPDGDPSLEWAMTEIQEIAGNRLQPVDAGKSVPFSVIWGKCLHRALVNLTGCTASQAGLEDAVFIECTGLELKR